MLRHRLIASAVLPAVVGVAACTGVIGDPPGLPASTSTSFVCNTDEVPQALPLRRLTKLQYENTVRDLVRFALPDFSDAIIAEVQPQLDLTVNDVRVGPDKHFAGLTRLDQAVQQQHIDNAYAVAAVVGEALTINEARLSALAGTCATDADASNDDDCLDELLRRFGERALRRPMSDEDVAFYRGPAGSAPFEPADYADALALLMNAPPMLYFVEHGQAGEDGDVAALDAWELATRLSYHFWQTAPDEALFQAARDGSLLTEDGYQAQVERIFNDARTRDAVGEFFGQWMENTALEELDSRVGTPVFDAMRGDFTPGPELRENMLQEVVDAALYYTFDNPDTYAAFFASDRSFARTADLAELYGVQPWTDGEPPVMTDPARAGLLTRAALTATGSANTRPIIKGVYIRIALLCDEIPPPPANAAANPPMLSDELSTREVVEQLTHTGACAGCHATLINPLGFATENFDALGRSRTEQQLFDPETGAQTGTAAIDTSSVPAIEHDDTTPSTGAADLTQLILQSPKPHACFARQYFRFTFGRIEDFNRDGCALAAVKDSLDADQPLAEALRAVALNSVFKQRSFLDE